MCTADLCARQICVLELLVSLELRQGILTHEQPHSPPLATTI